MVSQFNERRMFVLNWLLQFWSRSDVIFAALALKRFLLLRWIQPNFAAAALHHSCFFDAKQNRMVIVVMGVTGSRKDHMHAIGARLAIFWNFFRGKQSKMHQGSITDADRSPGRRHTKRLRNGRKAKCGVDCSALKQFIARIWTGPKCASSLYAEPTI